MPNNTDGYDFLNDIKGIVFLPKRFYKLKHYNDADFLDREMNKAIAILEGYAECINHHHQVVWDSNLFKLECSRCGLTLFGMWEVKPEIKNIWKNTAKATLDQISQDLNKFLTKIGEKSAHLWVEEISNFAEKIPSFRDAITIGQKAQDWFSRPTSLPTLTPMLLELLIQLREVRDDCIEEGKHHPTFSQTFDQIICRSCRAVLFSVTREIHQKWTDQFTYYNASEAWIIIFHCFAELDKMGKHIPDDFRHRFMRIYQIMDSVHYLKVANDALQERKELIAKISMQTDRKIPAEFSQLKTQLSALSSAKQSVENITKIYYMLWKVIEPFPVCSIPPEKIYQNLVDAEDTIVIKIRDLDRDRRRIELNMMD